MLLATPVTVALDRLIDAIEKFNLGGQNPYGPNVPVMGHSPLLFSLAGVNVEFPFYAVDRPAETNGHPTIRTRHPVLYPMTRAMIMRQWHRVYAFDVLAGAVTGVKLLVGRRQDPELFGGKGVRSTGAHRATHPCGASGASGSVPTLDRRS